MGREGVVTIRDAWVYSIAWGNILKLRLTLFT